MNNTDFDKIVQDTITSITTVLTSKAKEYADDTDRLHNFKVAALCISTKLIIPS